MTRGRAILLVAAALVCTVPTVLDVGRYLHERRQLTAEYLRLEAEIAERDARIMLLAKARQRVIHNLGVPLGTSLEQAGAVVRSTLLEAAERCGLGDPNVTAAPAEPLISPLVKTRIPEFRARALRSKPDAMLLHATLSGKAAPDQALRTIAMLEAQPWVISVNSFSMRPLGKARDRVDLSVEVAGWFAPDLTGAPSLPSGVVDTPPAVAAAWSGLLSRNPFTPPELPRPDPVTATDRVERAPSPEHPLNGWRLTAIAMGQRGPEVWLVHAADGRAKTLLVGETVQQATLVAASGETARLRVGDAEYEVHLGQSLADKIPAIQ